MLKTVTKFAQVAAMTILLTPAAQAQDCKPAHQFKTIEEGVLNIVTWELPPYTTQGPNGELLGIEGELVRRIAKAECLQVKVAFTDPGANIQYVVSGRADIAVGDWYRTAERAKVVGLSKPTFLDLGGIIAKQKVEKLDDLAGKKVGSVQGYLWDDELKAMFGEDFKIYPDPVAVAQDLAAGRIDAAVDGYLTSLYAQNKNGAFKGMTIVPIPRDERIKSSLETPQSGVVYSLGNPALGVALDAHITTFHDDGTLTSLLRQYDLDVANADVGEPRLIQ